MRLSTESHTKIRERPKRLSDLINKLSPKGSPYSVCVFEHKRKRLRTSNMSENLNDQINAELKSQDFFPNTGKFKTRAILMEIYLGSQEKPISILKNNLGTIKGTLNLA